MLALSLLKGLFGSQNKHWYSPQARRYRASSAAKQLTQEYHEGLSLTYIFLKLLLTVIYNKDSFFKYAVPLQLIQHLYCGLK